MKLQPFVSCALAVLLATSEVNSLSYNPDDYIEVYPDPRDSEVLQGRTPLYFALIQSLGQEFSQLDGSGVLAGVKVALDHINNDSSLLPGYTLHYTFANSNCNRTVSLQALHSQLFHEPKKIAIIGSGCSVATEPAAEVSHFYNITQISCLSGSSSLSNRVRFPRYFQLLTTAERLANAYYGVIKEYKWRKVALIIQDENLFTVTMNRLKMLLRQGNVDYSENIFNSSSGIAGLGPNPFHNGSLQLEHVCFVTSNCFNAEQITNKGNFDETLVCNDEHSRIFVLSMYPRHARSLLCEAFYRHIHLPQYLLLTSGLLTQFWWKEQEDDLSCTADERESILPFTLSVSKNFFLDELKDFNLTTSINITGGEFLAEERKFFEQPPLNISFYPYSQYCHDATWTLAFALNKTIKSLLNDSINEKIMEALNSTTPFRLEDFDYSYYNVMEIIYDHLRDTSFDGVTGPVSFDDQGIRTPNEFFVHQYRNITNVTDGSMYFERTEIGRVIFEGNVFNAAAGESSDTIWKVLNGSIPYDGVPMENIVTVHPALTSVCILLACAGIVFALISLSFNFIYRNAKLIKLASTRLNYLIGIGAIILYVNIVLFVIPITNSDVASVFCNLTPWLTAIGYSFCYGAILAKMARVYYIFNNPTAKKKHIKDSVLVVGVMMLVSIDLVILVIYTLVEGIRGNLAVRKVPHEEKPTHIEGVFGIITNNFIYTCNNSARDIFLGILYGYKMLLQIVAILLAFSIRKVKVKGVDDAKYIGASVYVTSIVLAIIVVATYTLKDTLNGFAALFCSGFLIGTTVILLLVFTPLMVGLYADPKGADIFKSNTTGHFSTTGGTAQEFSSEMQRKIKELENEIKAKDKLLATYAMKMQNQTSQEKAERTVQFSSMDDSENY